MSKEPTQDDLRRLVDREVHYCVSALVHTLAQAYTGNGSSTIENLAEQAAELSAPIPDYEEAARQSDVLMQQEDGKWCSVAEASDLTVDEGRTLYDSAEQACLEHDIEPYEWEVYEHWIVSDWLAGKLEAEGEKVDRDFAGLTVWARTTTGQAILLDSVIERIWRNLHTADPA
jgi:hypothetical protein